MSVNFSDLESFPVPNKAATVNRKGGNLDEVQSYDGEELKTGESAGDRGGEVLDALKRMFSWHQSEEGGGVFSGASAASAATGAEDTANRSSSLKPNDEPDDQSCCEGARVTFATEATDMVGDRHKDLKVKAAAKESVGPPLCTSFSDGEDSTSERGQEEDEEEEEEVFMHHLKQDVRDKHGKLRGIADLIVTIRGAGVAEYPGKKRAMVCMFCRITEWLLRWFLVE